MKKAGILGATGFVGCILTAALIERGISVHALARDRNTILPGAEIIPADLLHDDLARHFSGLDAVINLVGILHENHGGFEAIHRILPRRIAQACIDARVPRLLHMSALGASPEGPSAYLVSKARGEEAVRQTCENSLTRYTIFRPSVILGENDHFISLFSKLMRLSPILPIVCPGAKLQPILVEDVARAFSDSLILPETFGKTYGLCGPRVYTLIELVDTIAKSSGLKRWLVPLPDSLSYLQARLLEFAPGPLMTRDNYLSLQKDNVCDAPFPEIFGWQPQNIAKLIPLSVDPLHQEP